MQLIRIEGMTMDFLRNDDLAKLLLRITVGGLMLSHGIGKIVHGISGAQSMTVSAGLPEFLAYGVYIGEVIAPLLLLIGYYSRIAALVLAFNMGSAIYIAHSSDIFMLNKFGAPVIEVPLFYLMAALAIFLFGPGRHSVNYS